MARPAVLLSDAIEEFLRYRRSAGFRPNTLAINERALRKLLGVVGNIQCGSLEARHGEQFQAYLMGKGYKPNTVAANLTAFAAFVKWLRTRHYLGARSDPMANVRSPRSNAEPRQRILRENFDDFLDATQYPYERMVCALGLYLFLRASEIQAIHLKDIDLDRGEILVHVEKTNQTDPMPISTELDRELRRYLRWYASDLSEPFAGDMYLVPRIRRRPFANDGTGPGGGYIVERKKGNTQPYTKVARPHRYVQRTLVKVGIPIRDAEGKSLMEGVHTLRRSGARALFDDLVENSNYDGALRLVSAMLHHKSTVMTERYLGLDVDVKKRNDLIRGKQMFTVPDTGNVIDIASLSRRSESV
jgi:integrase